MVVNAPFSPSWIAISIASLCQTAGSAAESAARTVKRSAAKLFTDRMRASVTPPSGAPFANTASAGARSVLPMPPRNSLGGNAASRRRIDRRDHQRDEPLQHRIGKPVRLRDTQPLRRIAEQLRGQREQIAA